MEAVMSSQIGKLSAVGMPRLSGHQIRCGNVKKQIPAFSQGIWRKNHDNSTWQNRAWLGRQQSPNPTTTAGPGANKAPVPLPTGAEVRSDGLVVEQLVTLETSIDDMAPQLAAYVMEALMMNGAKDVWAQNILMQKGRPGLLLSTVCNRELADPLLRLILRETTTLGVRVTGCERVSLQKVREPAYTPWGWVAVNAAYLDNQLVTFHADYDEAVVLAKKHNVPLKVVIDTAHKSFLETDPSKAK